MTTKPSIASLVLFAFFLSNCFPPRCSTAVVCSLHIKRALSLFIVRKKLIYTGVNSLLHLISFFQVSWPSSLLGLLVILMCCNICTLHAHSHIISNVVLHSLQNIGFKRTEVTWWNAYLLSMCVHSCMYSVLCCIVNNAVLVQILLKGSIHTCNSISIGYFEKVVILNNTDSAEI